jgi:predicted RNA-binding Zn-ribbon protein involved in translation (DUF1610 family)
MGANERGDSEWLENFAARRECEPGDLICRGCKTDQPANVCANCKIKVCAMGRGVEFCNDCAEYPCPLLTDLSKRLPHLKVLFRNLAAIKEKGVDVWLAEEKKRWSCPECGERFFWYSEKCTKCGAELYNAMKEADSSN